MKRLRVKIFADGADFDGILKMYANPLIKGFTTNPSLMRKAGVTDYEGYARKVIAAVPDRPISFEVFADDLDGMIKQARVIASWGDNVNVKIPVMNTQREFTGRAIETLSKEGVAVNVTAVFTLEQVRRITERLAPETPAIVSVFAGRIADTGRDPVPHMAECVKILKDKPQLRADLGEPARADQHLPGRCDRLPDHHRHQRRDRQTGAGRQGPRRLFAGNRRHVLPRRHWRRVFDRHRRARAAAGRRLIFRIF